MLKISKWQAYTRYKPLYQKNVGKTASTGKTKKQQLNIEIYKGINIDYIRKL